VETDLPQGLLGVIAGAALKSRSQKTTSVEFVRPKYNPKRPDYTVIHRVVQEALH